MKKEAIKPFQEPATGHTIEDRRALTADALKVANHELKKEFQARLKACEKAIAQCQREAEPTLMAYNEAAASLISSLINTHRDDWRFSFQMLSGARDTRDEGDEDADLALILRIHTPFGSNFFHGVSDSRIKAFRARWENARISEPGHYRRGFPDCDDLLEWGVGAHGDDSYDLEVGLHFEIVYGEDSLDVTRWFDITASPELAQARQGLTDLGRRLEALHEDRRQAERNIDRLPSMIKELDMSATIMRIRDAGGEQFLEQIISGVDRILKGDLQLSGTAMALGTQQESE